MRLLFALILSVILSSLATMDMKAGDHPSGDLRLLMSKFDKESANKGIPVRVSKNGNGDIIEIGYRIFNDNILSSFPDSLILRFIERYLLVLDVVESKESPVRRMADDHVVFIKGNRNDIFKAAQKDIDISIEKRYSTQKREILVFLSNRDKDVDIVMSFPPSYELLLGQTRSELENAFPKMLLGKDAARKGQLKIPETEEYKPGILGSAQYNTYHHPGLNDRAYFSYDSTGALSPVFSDSFPEESAANLFIGYADADRMINLNQKLYGFKETGLTTSVGQWISYCRDNGLDMYFGVEKTFPDHLLALITAVHPELMYIHLLSVEIPLDIACNPHSVINGKISTFIPTHNLKSLYEEQEN